MLRKIYVIRHIKCVSKPNEKGELVDEDIGIKGQQDAEELASRLEKLSNGERLAVLSSDAKRAKQTASIIARCLHTYVHTTKRINRNTFNFLSVMDTLMELAGFFNPEAIVLVTHRAFIDEAMHLANHDYGYGFKSAHNLNFGYGAILILDTQEKSIDLIPGKD